MLKIIKLADDLYTAEATRPDVDLPWSTPEAMSARQLIKELSGRGAHPIDIADVLNEQDPDWIAKIKESRS